MPVGSLSCCSLSSPCYSPCAPARSSVCSSYIYHYMKLQCWSSLLSQVIDRCICHKAQSVEEPAAIYQLFQFFFQIDTKRRILFLLRDVVEEEEEKNRLLSRSSLIVTCPQELAQCVEYSSSTSFSLSLSFIVLVLCLSSPFLFVFYLSVSLSISLYLRSYRTCAKAELSEHGVGPVPTRPANQPTPVKIPLLWR